MRQNQEWCWRPVVLATLAKKSPSKPGRTVMMKFAYLLQTLRGVPLGYNFELYNYGPYDSDVLTDLSHAASLNAVESRLVFYPSGYGYEYSPADGYDELCERVEDELTEIDDDIDWVVNRFGAMNASKLELYSTIIFANREMRRKKQPSTVSELVRRVHQIKPHFAEVVIESAIIDLADDDLVELADE